MKNQMKFSGIIRGRVIELDADSGLPDGQPVNVIIQLTVPQHDPMEGLRKSFGAWANDAESLDAYLERNQQQRKRGQRD